MVQHFMKDEDLQEINSLSVPKLYYMGKILPEISAYPRVMHSHANHVEISIIYSGKSEYLINDQKRTIKKGDILIYNSNTVHDEFSGENVKIGSYFFAIGNLNIPNLRPNALISDDVEPVFHIEEGFSTIISLCENMLYEMENATKYSKYVMQNAMMSLLNIISTVIYNNNKKTNCNKNYELGKKIIEYIDTHYLEPLTMSDICKALNLSESYVSHVFKDMLGYSPMQYVLRRKIGEAQTLLISTDLTITEISRMVGYDSLSHFNQRFLKFVGISAGKFRKKYRETSK